MAPTALCVNELLLTAEQTTSTAVARTGKYVRAGQLSVAAVFPAVATEHSCAHSAAAACSEASIEAVGYMTARALQRQYAVLHVCSRSADCCCGGLMLSLLCCCLYGCLLYACLPGAQQLGECLLRQ
eukprot:18762-Heterococcus_DN1.PRE.1